MPAVKKRNYAPEWVYDILLLMNSRETKNLTDPYAFVRVASAFTVFMTHFDVFCNMFGYGPATRGYVLRAAGHGAVWVFFFISGFFNVRGFTGADPVYPLTKKGVLLFYKNRFLRIILPAWCFIFLALSVSEPAFVSLHPAMLIRFITCTYTGDPGCSSIAAVWFVSTIAWLYVLTPVIACLIRKLESHEGRSRMVILLVLVTALGFAERLFLKKTGAEWVQEVFVPFYCNLDLYLAGALAFSLCGKMKAESRKGMVMYGLSFFIVPFLLLFHSRINYLAETDDIYRMIYQYIMPSVFIPVLVAFCLVAESAGYVYERADKMTIRKNPLRIVDMLGAISYEFYLSHSMILFQLSFLIHSDRAAVFRGKLFLLAVPVTLVFAFLLHRMTDFRKRGDSLKVRQTVS